MNIVQGAEINLYLQLSMLFKRLVGGSCGVGNIWIFNNLLKADEWQHRYTVVSCLPFLRAIEDMNYT